MESSVANETQVTPGSDVAPGTDVAQDPRIARSCARILDAATELLVEGGSRAVTVDAISERSGVAKSTMYRHFPSRTELLVAVLRHNMPDIDFECGTDGFEACLRDLVRSVAASMADPHWAGILPALMSLKLTIPDIEDLDEADRADRLARLQQVLDLGVAEGLIPSDTDARTTLHLLVGPLFIAALNHQLDVLEPLADEVVDRYVASCRALS